MKCGDAAWEGPKIVRDADCKQIQAVVLCSYGWFIVAATDLPLVQISPLWDCPTSSNFQVISCI